MQALSTEIKGIFASLAALSLCAGILLLAHKLNADLTPILPASLGAAAVLMFLAPNSPMASLRALLLGNSCSAIIGCSFYAILGDSHFVAIASVGSAIACMHWLKCQHPPGGATALLFVVLGDQLSSTSPIANLILFGSCLGIFAGSSYIHRRLTTLPSRQVKPATQLSNKTLKTAIKALNLSAEIDTEQAQQLSSIINSIEKHSLSSEHTCQDLPLDQRYLHFDTSIEEALERFKTHRIVRLPILYRDKVPMGEFCLCKLTDKEQSANHSIEKLIKKYRYTGKLESDEPQHCGQVINDIPIVESETNAIQAISSIPSPFCVVDNTGKFLGMYSGD